MKKIVKWIIRLVVLCILLELAYIGAAQIFFNTEIGHDLMNLRPEKLKVSWSQGQSFLPGRLSVKDLVIERSGRKFDWKVELDEGKGTINLLYLIGKKFSVGGLRGSGLKFSMLKIKKDEQAGEKRKKGRWILEFRDAKADKVEQISILQYVVAGSGQVELDGRFRGKEYMKINKAGFQTNSGDIRDGKRRLAGYSNVELEFKSKAFSPVEHKDLSALQFFSGRLKGETSAAGLEFLNYYFQKTPWIILQGSGNMEFDLTLDWGRLKEGSQLTADADDIAVDVLDYSASGEAHIKASVTEKEGQFQSTVDVNFNDFQVKMKNQPEPYIFGSGFHLHAVTPSNNLTPPFEGLSGYVEIPESRVPDLTIYNSYMGQLEDLSILGGYGTINSRLDFSSLKDEGSGQINLKGEDMEIQFGGLRFKGLVTVKTKVRSDELKGKRFDLDGSEVQLQSIKLYDEDRPDKYKDSDWWGKISIMRGELNWSKPVSMRAGISAEFQDTRPVVAVFAEKRQLWKYFGSLFETKNITATADIRAKNNCVEAENLEVSGQGLELLARLKLCKNSREGVLFAKRKGFTVSVLLEGDKRERKWFGSKKWYKEQLARQTGEETGQ